MDRVFSRYVMNKTQRGASPSVQSFQMESFMYNSMMYNKARSNLRWAVINAVLSAIILYDVYYVCPAYSYWWRTLEYISALGFSLNTLFHFGQYWARTVYLLPVKMTPKQKDLIGIKTPSPYISVSTPVMEPQLREISMTPMNISAVSWLSGSSPGGSTMTASSWEYVPGKSLTSTSQKTSPDQTQSSLGLDLSRLSQTSRIIESEESLAQYLSEYESYERSLDETCSTMWRNSSRFKMDNAAVKGCNYQLSTPSPVKSAGSGEVADESYSTPSPLKVQQDIWARLAIQRATLVQWNSNLRRWISQTILERLVNEMQIMDSAFQRAGLSDMRIGRVGLERLKKSVQMHQVSQNMPTFPLLVRFLEVSTNQEYLVMRIRELAKGGCMSEFRWNGGGKMNGKEWDQHLPTDAALVMYLFATYLDTQLPPLPHNPEGQPFTSEYLVKYPNKVHIGRIVPLIQEVQTMPPHYVLHAYGETLDVGRGRNNFFHTILLFLLQLYVKEHGMIGRVNMGPSGVNILWVIGR